MLNCRQITRLVSQGMDARLPWHQRLAIRIHLVYCVWCRRYADQLQFLRRASRDLAGGGNQSPPEKLSTEAREQIRQRLVQAMNEARPPQ
jgi:predicted anti-sigma-YlaC factor YlaD